MQLWALMMLALLQHGRGLATPRLAVMRRGRSAVRCGVSVGDGRQMEFATSTASDAGEGGELEFLVHLTQPGSKVDPYWLEHLRAVRRPAAKALISQIVDSNPLGFEPATGPAKKGTLLEYVMAQKDLHPTKVTLVRVGEFYETYGVDSIMLVEHCGLNPMGNKVKAGCPVRNVQATLDGLTRMGFSVAIFEEMVDVGANQGPAAKARIKQRALAQVVSPGSPNYIHDMVLRPDDIEFGESRPYLGMCQTASGLSVCEIYLDEKAMLVSERLTVEAAAALIDSRGMLEPVYTQGITADSATNRILPDHVTRLSGYDESTFFLQVLREVATSMSVSADHFRVVRRDTIMDDEGSSSSSSSSSSSRPRPLYTTTAAQVGLVPNSNVPDLVSHLLPRSHQAHSARFLRRWLLTPPPYEIADRMRALCGHLRYFPHALPNCQPPPVGKVVTLLAARQCNVPLFRDIRDSIQGMLLMIGRESESESESESDFNLDLNSATNKYAPLVGPLLALTAHESGLPASAGALRAKGTALVELIDATLGAGNSAYYTGGEPDGVDTLCYEGPDPTSADENGRVPAYFVQTNEAAFRNCVVPDHCPDVAQAYATVGESFKLLCLAVQEDFAGMDMVHDIINNVLSVKSRPGGTAVDFIPQLDRNNKLLSRRFTTDKVAAALGKYVSNVQAATLAVERALQRLSDAVYADVATVVQAAHWGVVLEASSAHTAAALQKGWVMPTLGTTPGQPVEAAYATLADPDEDETGPGAMRLDGLIPYWLSAREAVPNTISLEGVFLLTAPNMSGKSTLLRATLVAALLANAGLLVPCLKSAWVPRYDNFFLRTASFDVPSEGKSAFGVEMDDIRIILRDASRRSLVMVDELGKGTSSRDGSALAGALLEKLDSLQLAAIFATHLHEIFQLPLQLRGVQTKRMGIARDGNDQPTWTFRVEDGVCTESLAMNTARRFGVPAELITRAEALADTFDQVFPAQGGSGGSVGSGGSTADGEVAVAEQSTVVLPPPETTPLRAPQTSMSHGASLSPPRTVPVDKPASTPSSTNAAKGTAAAPDQDPSYFLSSAVHRCDVQALNAILRRISGTRTGAVVEAGFKPPTALEGRACVYVLLLHGNGPAGDKVYVGETESIRQRLEQHTSAHKGTRITALVASSPNKSSARGTESLLIARLKAQGYDVEGGGSDAAHTLFSAN